MYYELYKSIKELIAASQGLAIDPENGQITGGVAGRIQDIQWFNAQYDGVIAHVPCVFVEFLPLVINRQTKQTNTTDIGIRLHVVSELSGSSEGGPADTDVERHERLCHEVLDAVEDKSLVFLDGQTRAVRLSGWTYHPTYNGRMATFIELKTKG